MIPKDLRTLLSLGAISQLLVTLFPFLCVLGVGGEGGVKVNSKKKRGTGISPGRTQLWTALLPAPLLERLILKALRPTQRHVSN